MATLKKLKKDRHYCDWLQGCERAMTPGEYRERMREVEIEHQIGRLLGRTDVKLLKSLAKNLKLACYLLFKKDRSL